ALLPSISPLLLSLFPFFLDSHAHHRDLHSFPTRRSSDLWGRRWPPRWSSAMGSASIAWHLPHCDSCVLPNDEPPTQAPPHRCLRSEEHTSELQSRFDLVCRLLLEKKKTDTIILVAHHVSE